MKTDLIAAAQDLITETALQLSATTLVKSGAVLVVVRSGILQHSLPVAVNVVDVALNQDLKALTPSQQIDPRYLAWALRRYESAILHECSKEGTTVQSIEFPSLLAFQIPLPPLAEQHRIVAAIEEHLSRLDAAVAGLKRVRAQLPRYRAAVLKAAMEGRLGNGEESGITMAQRPLGGFLDRIEAGKNFKCEERPPSSGEVGVVKVSAVTWGEFDDSESKTVTDLSRLDERHLVRVGDFLFSRANTIELVGACVIARRVERSVMLSDKILRFHLRSVDPRWVLIALRSPQGRTQIERLATGNQLSMRNISQESIARIEIPVPPAEDAERLIGEVDRRLSLIDAVSIAIDRALDRAGHGRRSILRRAFSGQLVSQDPNDEPASALLERIRAERAAAPVRKVTRSRRKAARGRAPGRASGDLGD